MIFSNWVHLPQVFRGEHNKILEVSPSLYSLKFRNLQFLKDLQRHLPLTPGITNKLVVSTPLKNISQIGNLPQIGVKQKKYLKPLPRKTCDSA